MNKYNSSLKTFGLKPHEINIVVDFINHLQELHNLHPNIFQNSNSILERVGEKEYLSFYYIYPYILKSVPDLKYYPFFAFCSALQSARIINSYLNLDLSDQLEMEKAWVVLNDAIIPRIIARLKWYEKGETFLPKM